ncbi:MAG TPA: hypothetical protein VGD91_25275 [Trebonia sp.]
MWAFLPAETVPFVVAAVQVADPDTFSSGQAAGPSREAAGQQLLSLIFGLQDGHGWPGPLAGLARNPQDRQALTELERKAAEAFEADPATAGQAAAVIAAFYRQRADAGNVRALVELGDFLYRDEPEAARAAYREAADAGYLPALIDLARLLHEGLEKEAALAALERAAATGDADLSAEARYESAGPRLPGSASSSQATPSGPAWPSPTWSTCSLNSTTPTGCGQRTCGPRSSAPPTRPPR